MYSAGGVVWAISGKAATARGRVIAPLYRNVPLAVADDPMLHELSRARRHAAHRQDARARDGAGGAIEEALLMSFERASAREAVATIGHALASQSQPVMFVGGTVTALYPLEAVMALRPRTLHYAVASMRISASTSSRPRLPASVRRTAGTVTHSPKRPSIRSKTISRCAPSRPCTSWPPSSRRSKGAALGTTRRVMTSKTSSPFFRGSRGCANRSLPGARRSRRSFAPSSSTSVRRRASSMPSPPTSRATSSGSSRRPRARMALLTPWGVSQPGSSRPVLSSSQRCSGRRVRSTVEATDAPMFPRTRLNADGQVRAPTLGSAPGSNDSVPRLPRECLRRCRRAAAPAAHHRGIDKVSRSRTVISST